MAVVHQKDKKSGITYAYESISHWDKEKKQSRAKRTLIGRLDTATGEITATDGRGRKHDVTSKQVPILVADTSRRPFGGTYLFNQIGEKIGITADLKQCFFEDYKKILCLFSDP